MILIRDGNTCKQDLILSCCVYQDEDNNMSKQDLILSSCVYQDEDGNTSKQDLILSSCVYQDEDGNTTKQDLILSFLEEATLAELLVLPGCSRKKAEALLELRPFGSWEKLVSDSSQCLGGVALQIGTC